MTDSGWRLPVLGNSTPEGCRQRTVVLRLVEEQTRALLFHTDIRSPKLSQIREDCRVTLLFYDHAMSVQLQIHGTATLHTTDSWADQLWNDSPSTSLKAYLAPFEPGIAISSPDFNLPPGMAGRVPERNEIEAGRRNFAVIRVLADSMEWLRLSREGNLRARFRYENAAVKSFEWVAP